MSENWAGSFNSEVKGQKSKVRSNVTGTGYNVAGTRYKVASTRYKAPSLVAFVALIVAVSTTASSHATVAAAQAPAVQSSAPIAPRALLDTYCVTCHNQRTKTAGLMFDTMDLAKLPEHGDVWEKTVRKLRGGMMPPPGVRRPDQASVDSMVSWLERSLDEAAAAHPNPGRVALHRLNRAEYAAAIEDLLGIKIDPAALLPKDDEAEGFDNVASVLTVSPSFLDQYISAARVVSARAVGNPAARPGSQTYRPTRGSDQSLRVDGLPLGTRGGLLVEHLFPADGDYKFNIPNMAIAGYVRGMEYKHTLIVTIDGVKVFQNTIGGEDDIKAIDQQQAPAVAAINSRFLDIPVKVTAGPHKVGVTFVARTFAEPDEVLHSFRPSAGEDRIPRIGSLEIQGPFNPTGVSQTPSRARVFVCQPKSASDELPCAKTILSALARKAYRRPITNADLDAPIQFYSAARALGDFDTAIRDALPTILASPKFLYRAERSPAGLAPGSIHAIGDVELASRLSFFLIGRAPDDELLTAAERGTLTTPTVLEAQVRRLLADPRSESLVTSFAFQWLKMRALEEIDPDPIIFPNFDDSLRAAFRREMELFVDSILREDRPVLELLTANHTFVNERLALHYGIPDVRGDRFRRVTLTDANRWGLLGKGAVLLTTSYANRTAPVLRGAWILENLLGTPPSPPPPDVEAFQENKDGEKQRSVREIMEQHRAKPSCNACHGVMDPLGFSLENFDAIGEWRAEDRYAGTAIDASGKLVDGTAVNSPADLRVALTRRPEQFVQTLTERLMTYALGRTVDYYDMPAVRKIVREAARDQYRFSSIVMGIVRSDAFRMRMVPEAERPSSSTASLTSDQDRRP
jgi:mono/diheme cytochrome c family protein